MPRLSTFLAVFLLAAASFLPGASDGQPRPEKVLRYAFEIAETSFDPQRISDESALTQSFLVQYVIARESFDIDAMEANYRRVSLWSADQARADYLSAVQASTPSTATSTS